MALESVRSVMALTIKFFSMFGDSEANSKRPSVLNRLGFEGAPTLRFEVLTGPLAWLEHVGAGSALARKRRRFVRRIECHHDIRVSASVKCEGRWARSARL